MLGFSRLVSAVGAVALCVLLVGPVAGEPPKTDEVTDDEQKAAALHDMGRYAEAAQAWEQVLEGRPDDHWAKLGLAKALLRVSTAESLGRAEKVLAGLGEQDWTHPTRGNVLFEVDTTRASVLMALADHQEGEGGRRLLHQAIPLWERVLEASPSNPFALAGLARANLALERDAEGIDYAERYIGLSRESQRRWKKQRDTWLVRSAGSATPEQLQFFTAKVEGAREKEEQMLLVLGATHLRRSEPDKALARYDAILEMGPPCCAAYLGRAQALVALCRHAAAVEDLERCLEIAKEETPADVRKKAAKLLERCRRMLHEEAPPR